MNPRSIVLDRTSTMPLHRQLEEALRTAILNGQLASGARILSSRELQTHLGLSRNTILSALGQLQSEGHLITRPGAGTFVADLLRHGSHHKRASKEPDLVPTDAAASFIATQLLAANLDRSVPFRPGIPALDLFPAKQFRQGLQAAAWTSRVLDYPVPLGEEPLRAAIAKRLHQTRGVGCSPDQIVVTYGAQAAFALIAQVLLKKGDRVLLEEPGYPSVRAVFAAKGMHLAAAPVDESGVDVARFAGRRAALIHTTPSHQYPTGAILPLERRLALLEWASAHKAWVIEDDYDSEFDYTGKAQPALYGLDGGNRVLYVGTFSKVLSPALRVGFIVVPQQLQSVFAAAQQVIGGQPSPVIQLAIARLLESGHFGRHIRKMRKLYDQRRLAVTHELTRALGDSISIQDTKAGLHFVVHLPKWADADAVSKKAAEAGIVVPSLSEYFMGKPFLNGLVLGYASCGPDEARRAAALLAVCVAP